MMKKVFVVCLMLTLLVGSIGSSSVGFAAEKELTLWTWKIAYVPGFRAVADAFEVATGVKINIQAFTPDMTYKQKVKAAANVKLLPDIVHWWGTVGEGFENTLLELTPYIDKELREGIYSSSWDTTTVSEANAKKWREDPDASEVLKSLRVGECYGVPLDVGGFFTFYGNKTIIEDAGLEAKAPKTWEEFIDMMITIKERTGIPGLVFGGKFADLWQNWCGNALMPMYSGPEGFSAILSRETRLSDPDNIVIIKAAEKLVENDLLLPGVLGLTIDDGDQVFATGRAAFNLGGSFTMATLKVMGVDLDNVIAFPIPPIAGSKIMQWKCAPFLLTMLSVSKYSENADLAFQFVKSISSKKGAVMFGNGAYTIPAVKLGAEEKENVDPGLLAMLNSFSYEEDLLGQVPEYPALWHANVEWQVLGTMYQKMFSGAATAEEVAARFDEAMEKEIEAGR